MSYLPDTHTFLWAIIDKSKLSVSARQTIQNTNNEVSVSAISFWEVSLKYSLGKLAISGFLPEELPDLAIKSGFTLLPFLPNESSSYYQLPSFNNHKDPFDKMLIWQAIQQDLILISKDKDITQYNRVGLSVLW